MPQRRKPRRKASPLLRWIDQWMLTCVSGIVVLVWLCADIFGLALSQGTQAALLSFVGYTAIKMRTDARWRALEGESDRLDQVREIAEKVKQAKPGSPEAQKAAAALTAVALSETTKDKP